MKPSSARERFSSYEIIEEIGSGGFGRVFKARHIHPNYRERLFAIKRLRSSRIHDHLAVERFRRESYAVAMLRHKNIVRTFEAGQEGDEAFIAMEYVQGVDLGTILDAMSGRPIPKDIAIHICCESLAGLQYGHNLRDVDNQHIPIIHRDIKSANILVSFDGAIKITDFGVAVIRGAGPIEGETGVLGTLGYLSPEVIYEEEAGPPADIFATGALLFEMLCGRMAFAGETTTRLVKNTLKGKMLKANKVNVEISKDLGKIISTALEPSTKDRYGKVEEMLADLAPMVPPQAGMELAVGAWVRTLFPERFAESIRLTQRKRRHSRLMSVAVCSDTEQRFALISCLQGLGYAVDAYRSVSTFEASLKRTQPIAIFVDLKSKEITPEAVSACMIKGHRMFPVIAVAEDFDPYDARTAAAIGAVDILCPPFEPSRVDVSISSTHRPLFHQKHVSQDDSQLQLRVYLVSRDSLLLDLVNDKLAALGYLVTWCQTAPQALMLCKSNTPHGVLFDCGDEDMTFFEFADEIRKRPGFGMLPIVALNESGALAEPLPTRTMIRKRDEEPATMCANFNQLLKAHHLGRTFERYRAVMDARLQHGGQERPAETVDISRGGTLVLCTKIIPVGSDVLLRLMFSHETVELPGVVVRVQMPSADTPDLRARIGIAFAPADASQESPLIELIKRMGESNRIPGQDSPPPPQ